MGYAFDLSLSGLLLCWKVNSPPGAGVPYGISLVTV
jgi:hypothetical protein